MRLTKPFLTFLFSLLWLPLTANAFETKAEYAFLVDDETGAVLFEKNPDEPMYPSSMTKLMTIYMVFERLKNGTLSMEDTLPVSKKAWQKGGSKMFVEVGNRVSIADLLRGIIVQSGNDACIVVAEGLQGSVEAFANAMNEKAAELGMTGSHFKNASGWPEEGHVMTARDLAILSSKLINNFPEYYPIFAEKKFTYNGITQSNRNLLLWRNSIGVDGLKTGHTEAAGYGLTASAVKNGRRLIVVVNGLDSERERADEADKLLSYGFLNFRNQKVATAGEKIDVAKVWFGEQRKVPLVLQSDLIMTLPNDKENITAKVVYNEPIPAPIKEGEKVASLVIEIPGMQNQQIPLVAGEAVPKLSGFRKAVESAKLYIYQWLGLELV